MTFNDFRDSGLLWALNRTVFHPRGYAIAFNYDEETNEVVSWGLLGDGSEPWSFDSDTDDRGFERFNKFLDSLKGDK